jgi:hypothetical protein
MTDPGSQIGSTRYCDTRDYRKPEAAISEKPSRGGRATTTRHDRAAYNHIGLITLIFVCATGDAIFPMILRAHTAHPAKLRRSSQCRVSHQHPPHCRRIAFSVLRRVLDAAGRVYGTDRRNDRRCRHWHSRTRLSGPVATNRTSIIVFQFISPRFSGRADSAPEEPTSGPMVGNALERNIAAEASR